MGVMEELPGLLDPLPGGDKLVNAVDYVVNWARANSLWPLVFGTSCCAIEMMATGASDNDWARFGLEVARATPRQADLIVLAGTIVEKMGSRLTTLYEQMPGPKYVIAMGACTISGGPFYYDSYSVVKGADRLIPVDVYIPGCPPRPEALLYGIMQLQALIKTGSLRRPLTPRPLYHEPISDLHSKSAEAWDAAEKIKQEGLKEAQEKFKLENPEFKGFIAKRIVPPKFEEVPRVLPPPIGLSPTDMYNLAKEKFPDLKVYGMDEVSDGKLAEINTDKVLDLQVASEQYIPFINFLKNHNALRMDFLFELTAIDWKDHFDVVVHLLSIDHGHKIFVRCSLPHNLHPEIDTLAFIYKTANWHEREVYDFFGIRFKGHPDLRRLFLEDHFVGHPLRKDFEDVTRVVKRPY